MSWSLKQALFGPVVNAENNPYAKATTPDRLIAANIVQSFAKDFDNWSVENWSRRFCPRVGVEYGNIGRMFNRKTGVYLVFAWKHDGKLSIESALEKKRGEWVVLVDESAKGGEYRLDYDLFETGMVLDKQSSTLIVTERIRIAAAHKAAKEAADRALAVMQANEAKWELAEKLLGMKRNAIGALVPVQQEDGNANSTAS